MAWPQQLVVMHASHEAPAKVMPQPSPASPVSPPAASPGPPLAPGGASPIPTSCRHATTAAPANASAARTAAMRAPAATADHVSRAASASTTATGGGAADTRSAVRGHPGCPVGDGGSSGNCDDGVGCVSDSTLECSGGHTAHSCSCGDNPELQDPGLSCSTPQANAGEDDYCCFTNPSGFSPSSCVPDDTLTSVCPDADSYGYQCDTGDQPSTLDPSLQCSDPTPDADGVHGDYCCTYG
jgi:hypothetical protein